jgi:hypothetical protein
VAAAKVPIGKSAWIGAVVPHTSFWEMRVRGTDLSDVKPFRIAAEGLADKVKDLGDLMVMVTNVRVEGDDDFLILFSYAGAPDAWWPWGNHNILDPNCGPVGAYPAERDGSAELGRVAKAPVRR